MPSWFHCKHLMVFIDSVSVKTYFSKRLHSKRCNSFHQTESIHFGVSKMHLSPFWLLGLIFLTDTIKFYTTNHQTNYREIVGSQSKFQTVIVSLLCTFRASLRPPIEGMQITLQVMWTHFTIAYVEPNNYIHSKLEKGLRQGHATCIKMILLKVYYPSSTVTTKEQLFVNGR